MTAMLAYLATTKQAAVKPEQPVRPPGVRLHSVSSGGSGKGIYRLGRPLSARMPHRRHLATNAGASGRINNQHQQNRNIHSKLSAEPDAPGHGAASAKLPAKTRLYTIGCGFSKDHNPTLRITDEYCI